MDAQRLRGLGRTALNVLVSLAIVLILWVVALKVLDVSSYIGKGPLDVWEYLMLEEDAAQNRAGLLSALGRTMADAAIGFVCGLVVAVAIATLFTLFRGVEHAMMPMAMLLRSVPLVAMAPIIILVFGRETAAVGAMGGIVVLFPALVTIVMGLRSASPAMQDVVTVFGGSKFSAFRKVALPSSLPAFFTALRISIPGALTGALLAEWLATGRGIGYEIISSVSRARYDAVWAAVVAVTLSSLVLYGVVTVIENAVMRRMGTKA
ncbi:ABC transporter permease [Arthrobacter ginkgonis]|uniref:ABC transporter permease n=1 Tax=Arthrobacter ginkgonis TaxID=1630594 RepID=A0ABP7CNV9_9MICC